MRVPGVGADAPRRSPTQQRGFDAESLALAHLQARGLVLVERNAGNRLGEIDLVMRDGAHWVFVEVRRRADRRFGGAAASVDFAKQRKLRRAASAWLAARFSSGRWPRCRFDVVAIDGDVIDWIADAF